MSSSDSYKNKYVAYMAFGVSFYNDEFEQKMSKLMKPDGVVGLGVKILANFLPTCIFSRPMQEDFCLLVVFFPDCLLKITCVQLYSESGHAAFFG